MFFGSKFAGRNTQHLVPIVKINTDIKKYQNMATKIPKWNQNQIIDPPQKPWWKGPMKNAFI